MDKTCKVIKQIQLDAREELLWDLCVCSKCGGGIYHHMDEPFYTCQGCGIMGESGHIPKLQKAKLDAWKQGMSDASEVDEISTVEGYVYLERFKQAILTARLRSTKRRGAS